MKYSPKVSIVTVCYNSEKTIRDTIESVLKQTYSNIEYIIVDGASTDSTLDIVREYEPLFHGRMRYVSEKDTGIYNAMNKGIRMTDGQLIGIINSDDFYEPDAVESIVENINSSQYQVIYGYMQVIGQYKNKKYIAKENHKNLRNEMIPHPTCFVTRKTYHKYGLFLEWFKAAADYELMLRLNCKTDVVFTQVRKVISHFRQGGTSFNEKYSLEREIARVMHGAITFAEFREKAVLFFLHRF